MDFALESSFFWSKNAKQVISKQKTVAQVSNTGADQMKDVAIVQTGSRFMKTGIQELNECNYLHSIHRK